MSMRERLAPLGWLLGAVAALAVTVLGVLGAQPGQVSAFALVPLMWSVALLAGFVHHWRLARRPLLDEQPGALLSS
jgi:lipopolysaccharide export LptBFGC system permease protein LptF